MHIVVCCTAVPDTASRIEVVNGVVDLSRVSMVMNPYDEYAVEEAVRLKERYGGTVSAVAVGGGEHKDVLRKALAMGADEAYLGDGRTDDAFLVAVSLARVIGELPGDKPAIVLCGKLSVQSGRGAVGPMLAGLLGIEVVSRIVHVDVAESCVELEREIEAGRQRVVASLPLLLTAEKGLNVPRKSNIKAVMLAKKKPIHSVTISVDEAQRTLVDGFRSVDRRRSCRMLGSVEEVVEVVVRESDV